MKDNTNNENVEHPNGDYARIALRATRKAQEESRKRGIPNVYSINGIIHYEQPDGSLSTTPPENWPK